MGIGSNLMVKSAEEEFREKEYENIIYETAYYVVVDKLLRDEAYDKVRELNEERKNPAMYVDKGEYIEYLDSALNESIIPLDKEKQINAVAKELFEKFEYDS